MIRRSKAGSGYVSHTDEQIKRSVMDSLHQDKRVNTLKIRIRVKNGIVDLTGAVLTSRERDAAGVAAKSVKGVSKINNYVAIVDTPPEDPLSRVA